MQLKEEPEGFVKAVGKQAIVKELLMAMSVLKVAGQRLDMMNHQSGLQLTADYQEGIKRLIVEVSQL